MVLRTKWFDLVRVFAMTPAASMRTALPAARPTSLRFATGNRRHLYKTDERFHVANSLGVHFNAELRAEVGHGGGGSANATNGD